MGEATPERVAFGVLRRLTELAVDEAGVLSSAGESSDARFVDVADAVASELRRLPLGVLPTAAHAGTSTEMGELRLESAEEQELGLTRRIEDQFRELRDALAAYEHARNDIRATGRNKHFLDAHVKPFLNEVTARLRNIEQAETELAELRFGAPSR